MVWREFGVRLGPAEPIAKRSVRGARTCNPERVDTIPPLVPSFVALARRMAVDVTPLRESRDFRLLWFGELISQTGHQITTVALFVQVDRLTGSTAAVGAKIADYVLANAARRTAHANDSDAD